VARKIGLLRLRDVTLEFDCDGGEFALTIGEFILSGLRAGMELPGRVIGADELRWQVVSQSDAALTVAGRTDGLSLQLSFQISCLCVVESKIPALSLTAAVSADAPFSLERVVLLQGAAPVAAPEWVYSISQRNFPIGSVRASDGLSFKSRCVTGWTRAGQTLFLTFPLRQSLPCALGGKIEGGHLVELQAECAVGMDEVTEIVAPPLSLCVTDAPHDYLEAYADGQREETMPPLTPRPVGWNSWDYIRDIVSEEYILKNLDLIAADPVLSKHIEYIVVDSGWEHRYGEWEPTYRFPHGMEWLVQQITDRGFNAGLWFAPCIIENCTINANWNPQLLARGRSGLPCQAFQCMLRYGFALDIKKPEARQWLHEVFARYRAMGFTYFKTDFLWQIANAVLYDGKRVPKGDLVREVLSIVREAVGPECHILGCNYPWETGCGLINSNRVSGDIAPYWNTVKRNAVWLAAKWWTHNRLWCNDPDFTICRGPTETSDDPDIDRMHAGDIYRLPDVEHGSREPYLSLAEAKTLLSLVLLTGGSVMLSDNLPRLNETGLDLLRKVVSAAPGRHARPVDLFCSEQPSLWVQEVTDEQMRIGLTNWSDEKAARTLDLAELTGRSWQRVSDFWTGEEIASSPTDLALELAPHETKLLVLVSEGPLRG